MTPIPLFKGDIALYGCPTDNRYCFWVGNKTPRDMPLGPRKCGCDVYCCLRSHAAAWEEMCNKLDGPWKDTLYVMHDTHLQFSGVEVTLHPDGTYQLSDTTGG